MRQLRDRAVRTVMKLYYSIWIWWGCGTIFGGAVRDRLLSAVLLADVAFVKELLRQHEEGCRYSFVNMKK